jgi:hypothetical protein
MLKLMHVHQLVIIAQAKENGIMKIAFVSSSRGFYKKKKLRPVLFGLMLNESCLSKGADKKLLLNNYLLDWLLNE